MSQKFKSEIELQALNNATTDTDKILVSDGGVIKYRTGAEILSDIGAQSALTNPVTGTGTTNYVSKWTGTNTQGNSQIFDNGANVGIGTTSPIYKLDVNSGTVRFGEGANGYVIISDNDYYGGELGMLTDNDESIAIKYQDGTFRYGGPNPGAETLVISGSSVGIGTSSPSAKLDVQASGTTQTSILGRGLDSNFRLTTRQDVSTNTYGSVIGEIGIDYKTTRNTAVRFHRGGGAKGGFISFTTKDGSEKMRIDSAGNVGIGTTSPSEKLHISSGNLNISSGNLRFKSSGIKDTNDSGGSAGQVLKSNNSGEVEWGWVPNTLVSGFLHTQNILGAAYFLPFNTTGETNLSQYYNTFIAPYSGRVRKMIIKFVNGLTPSATSFSTFRVVVNGSQYDFTPTTTGGGTTSMQGVYAFNDDDVVFSEGDKVQFAFITAGGTGLVQGCSATILIEYSQI